MATIDEEVKVDGVFGGVQTAQNEEPQIVEGAQPVDGVFGGVQVEEKAAEVSGLPAERTFWSSMKAFWLQDIDWNMKIDWNREIKVELTPKQQKVEDEINEFLHQEITWEKVRDFLFQEVTFGKKDKD